MLQIMNTYDAICLCDTEEISRFRYEQCGHIIIDDIDIIDNLELRHLISKAQSTDNVGESHGRQTVEYCMDD